MVNIDDYIEKIKDMPNVSVGGSEAYAFGDVILVCYKTLKEYGIARECEDKVMISANAKNAIGVRTPKHLAMKRVDVDDTSYCFVLQEKAKGVPFTEYCRKSPEEQLKMQRKLISIPNSHYEKYVSDIMQLLYCGIEPKPKNVFYDDDPVNGGFTTIDLLGMSDGEEFNPDSIDDIKRVYQIVSLIGEFTTISLYDENATEEQKEMSHELNDIIKYRVILAMRRVVPNFDKYERIILRTLYSDSLENLKKMGLNFDDLTLTAEEEERINLDIQKIVLECVEKIASGKFEFWQIDSNEIRISSDKLCLPTDFSYSSNSGLNRSDFDDEYDYRKEASGLLKERALNDLYLALVEYSKTHNNDFINQALSELSEIRQKGEKTY